MLRGQTVKGSENMIVGIGCDVVNMERLNKADEFLERFGKRILGKDELREFLAESKNASKEKIVAKLAKLYAAKEAFVKALGIGFRDGIFLADIQILHNDLGKPYFKIEGQAKIYLQKICSTAVLHLSISDDFPVATAMVIIESK